MADKDLQKAERAWLATQPKTSAISGRSTAVSAEPRLRHAIESNAPRAKQVANAELVRKQKLWMLKGKLVAAELPTDVEDPERQRFQEEIRNEKARWEAMTGDEIIAAYSS